MNTSMGVARLACDTFVATHLAQGLNNPPLFLLNIGVLPYCMYPCLMKKLCIPEIFKDCTIFPALPRYLEWFKLFSIYGLLMEP